MMPRIPGSTAMPGLFEARPRPGALIAVLCVALLVPGALAAEGDKTMTGTERYMTMYKSLRDPQLDTTRGAKVDGLVIQKDLTKITFESGYVWFTKPWKEGVTPAEAWFEGRGRIEMTPPVDIERKALKRAFEKESLNETFTGAFIIVGDDFYENLKDKLAPDVPGAAAAVAHFRERVTEHKDLQFSFEMPIIEASESEGRGDSRFLLEFQTLKQGWVAFYYSRAGLPGGQLGESMLFKVGTFDFFDPDATFPILTVFHDKAEYDSGKDLGKEDRDLIWMRDYKGEVVVERDGLVLNAKMDMTIESLVDNVKAVTVGLLSYYGNEQHPFAITKLTDAEGKPLDYLHRNHALLFSLPKTLKKGEKTVVHIEYNGDYIRPNPSIGSALNDPDIPADAASMARSKLSTIMSDASTFTLLNTYPWFPQSGYLKRHTFDWTIKVPTPYIAVASGTTKKRWSEGGMNCLHTVETEQVALASVLFGRYIEKSDKSARPVVNVLSLPKQQKQADDLLTEARTIITEYEKWFGPFPFEELDIAQMGFFYGFGQAPPGLVQLTGEAFLSGAEMTDIFGFLGATGFNTSFVHAFVAHEIGHEWWGHAVTWANANDQWLSESYTEYCSALYVQSTEGQKAFDAKLKDWRESASRSKDAGPISLGFRLGKHYTAQTYDKGPYVLHMLRLALQSQAVAAGGTVADGDKMFFESLKNFVAQFRFQNATTQDFQKVVKSTTKTDMDWFFDQWFRGNHWLNVEFKYDVRPTEDGKFLLTANFKQPDKNNVKQTIVPMYIHFDKDKIVQRAVYLQKAEQTMQIKLPASPAKVTLDDRKDILGDIKYVQ